MANTDRDVHDIVLSVMRHRARSRPLNLDDVRLCAEKCDQRLSGNPEISEGEFIDLMAHEIASFERSKSLTAMG